MLVSSHESFDVVAQLTFMQMQEEKRRSDNAVGEENVKLILQSHAKEVKQVRASAYLHFDAHMHRVFAPAAADECNICMLMHIGTFLTFFVAATRRP